VEQDGDGLEGRRARRRRPRVGGFKSVARRCARCDPTVRSGGGRVRHRWEERRQVGRPAACGCCTQPPAAGARSHRAPARGQRGWDEPARAGGVDAALCSRPASPVSRRGSRTGVVAGTRRAPLPYQTGKQPSDRQRRAHAPPPGAPVGAHTPAVRDALGAGLSVEADPPPAAATPAGPDRCGAGGSARGWPPRSSRGGRRRTRIQYPRVVCGDDAARAPARSSADTLGVSGCSRPPVQRSRPRTREWAATRRQRRRASETDDGARAVSHRPTPRSPVAVRRLWSVCVTTAGVDRQCRRSARRARRAATVGGCADARTASPQQGNQPDETAQGV